MRRLAKDGLPMAEHQAPECGFRFSHWAARAAFELGNRRPQRKKKKKLGKMGGGRGGEDPVSGGKKMWGTKNTQGRIE